MRKFYLVQKIIKHPEFGMVSTVLNIFHHKNVAKAFIETLEDRKNVMITEIEANELDICKLVD